MSAAVPTPRQPASAFYVGDDSRVSAYWIEAGNPLGTAAVAVDWHLRDFHTFLSAYLSPVAAQELRDALTRALTEGPQT